MSSDRNTRHGHASNQQIIAVATVAMFIAEMHPKMMAEICAYERKYGYATPLLASFWASCVKGEPSNTMREWLSYRRGAIAPIETFPTEWTELVGI